jgi:hypothetical protein
MPRLKLKKGSAKSTNGLCLGFKEIKLLFNAGPFPGGGDCLIVEADGKRKAINSNDLIADMDAYNILTR